MVSHHIVITGASTGIGYSLAEEFLKLDHHVWAGVRQLSSLKDLESKYPKLLHPLKMDVSETAQIEAAFTAVEKYLSVQTGEIKIALINNAGVAAGGPFEAMSLQEWKNVYNVNVFGLVETTKTFLPLLRKYQGTVVNIGSIAGRFASPYLSIYASSKAAVKGLSDSLRRELRPFGVRVILAEPGPIQTPIWNKSLSQEEKILGQISPKLMEIYGKATRKLLVVMKKTAADAVPVSYVTDKIVKAVLGNSTQPNYLIGKGIIPQAMMIRLLPTSWMDKVISVGMKALSKEKSRTH